MKTGTIKLLKSSKYILKELDQSLYRTLKRIKKFGFDIRLRMAVRKANRDAQLFKKRLMVLAFDGKPIVYEKQRLKELIKRGYFLKGTTISDLEKRAYYITK